MKKTCLAISCLMALSISWAQDITADEMMQLDNFRAQYKAQGKDLSPEDEIRLLQRLRAMKAVRPTGSTGAAVAAPAPALGIPHPFFAAPAAAPQLQTGTQQSEAEVKQRLAGLSKTFKPVEDVTFLKDGILFDGKRFADPEGRASRFAIDPQHGRVGYTVSPGMPDQALLKAASLAAPTEAVTLGRIRQAGRQWQFESVTGKSLSGELFFPLTDGVLIMRDSVGFRYLAGEGVKQINIPNGWFPTSIQRGNISATGWMLLEKNNAEEKSAALGLLSNMTKLLGVGAFNEYALLNLDSGQIIEINVNNDGKNTYSYSQCHKKNGMVNVCDRMSSYESMFSADGSPNPSHYFWRINWQWTSSGPVLLAKEGNLGSQLNAWNLNTGKKVTLFERTLGINSMTPRVLPDGRMTLSVQMGFGSEAMGDVGAEIDQRPDIRSAATGKAGS